MSARPLLERLEAAGVELTAQGSRLHVKAPPGVIQAAEVALIRQHKAALLRLVGTPDAWRAELEGWPVEARGAYEERAAIREYDGRQPREEAELGAFREVREQLLAPLAHLLETAEQELGAVLLGVRRR